MPGDPYDERSGVERSGVASGVAWSAVDRSAPDLARAVEGCFGARRMKCLATMRGTGWPRLSETSGVVIAAGHVWLLMIPSAKATDVRRDARVAVHCGSPSDEWGLSARLTGWAREAEPDLRGQLYAALPTLAERQESSLLAFTMAVTEVVATGPDPGSGDIAIEWWTPGAGLRRTTRPRE